VRLKGLGFGVWGLGFKVYGLTLGTVLPGTEHLFKAE